MARLKVSKGAVHGTLKRAAETGSVASKARSGRPKVTTPSEDRSIKLCSLRDKKVTSSQIQNLLNKKRKTPISKSTIKRRLSSNPQRTSSSPETISLEEKQGQTLGVGKDIKEFPSGSLEKHLIN
ncbi:hypothetical protein LDENG_00033420 [Lucifuga dentata]|nr:hypothetical protein LDENG_00033420 [Lucifuga dentata]